MLLFVGLGNPTPDSEHNRIGSKDNKKNVKKNLKIVKNKICIKSKEIFLVKQIHSNKFIFINK